MKKRYLLLLVLAVSGFGVFLYNYWSYSCGRCNNESLLTITLPAEILIGINLLSLVVLTLVHAWRRSVSDALICPCGENLHSSWQYCPSCGHVCTKKT